MNERHLGRAADAAAYASRLQADLGRVTAMLNDYRGSPGLEIMRERSYYAQRQLGIISSRLLALGNAAAPGRHPLSETEHIALEAALNLRDRLVESLSRYQRAGEAKADRDPG